MITKKVKTKKCKSCLNLFTPARPMQTTCCVECAVKHSNKPKVQKAYKIEKKKELMEKYPDKAKWTKLAQTVVNKYIRLRDSDKEKCISCDYRFENGSRQIHCSHFRPQGNNQNLRFYTLNMWASCSICNNHKSGNLIPYRIALIDKFGIEWVEKLEANHTTKKYTVEYLQKLIKVFRRKIKLYERKFR
jgi:hypothetical protein